MAAQAARLIAGRSPRRCAAAALVALLAIGITQDAAWAATETQDTSFWSGPEFGAALLHNVVRVSAVDINEQGFGLVVGADETWLYVLTARHVVSRLPPLGLDGAERPSARIEARLCAQPQAEALGAERLLNFDAGAADLALLRLPRPPDYRPSQRALADVAAVRVDASTWVLGFEQRCEVLASSGTLESGRDTLNQLRARHGGVRGGSSGAPLLIGSGLAGLVTRSDSIALTAHSLEHARELLSAQGWPWTLAVARNIPPTDPAAARIDLAETLSRYLFAVRETHGLLLQQRVARATFKDYVDNYNRAIARFRDARDKYDGALAVHWPAEVLPAWHRLRETLWGVHLKFWAVNTQARQIYESQTVPATVTAQMQALEPELVSLQGDIQQFLQILNTQEKPP